MKITLNVDEALLKRVVKSTGSKTKTAAIDYALREVDRRARLTKELKEGLGMTPEELTDSFDPASDAMALRAAEDPEKYSIK